MKICRVGDEKRKLETLGWWISTRVGKGKGIVRIWYFWGLLERSSLVRS